MNRCKTSSSPKAKKTGGYLFVISGPSGSGKTTLLEKVLAERSWKNKLRRSISMTTRARGRGEAEGRDYFFTSAGQFKALLKEKKILEWTSYLGYYYGTPKDFVDKQLNSRTSLVFNLDHRGAESLKRFYPRRTVTIFVLPPSVEELERRLRRRSREKSEKQIVERLRVARDEMGQAGKYDHCIVNDNFNTAVKELKDIVKSHIEKG